MANYTVYRKAEIWYATNNVEMDTNTDDILAVVRAAESLDDWERNDDSLELLDDYIVVNEDSMERYSAITRPPTVVHMPNPNLEGV